MEFGLHGTAGPQSWWSIRNYGARGQTVGCTPYGVFFGNLQARAGRLSWHALVASAAIFLLELPNQDSDKWHHKTIGTLMLA